MYIICAFFCVRRASELKPFLLLLWGGLPVAVVAVTSVWWCPWCKAKMETELGRVILNGFLTGALLRASARPPVSSSFSSRGLVHRLCDLRKNYAFFFLPCVFSILEERLSVYFLLLQIFLHFLSCRSSSCGGGPELGAVLSVTSLCNSIFWQSAR